MSIISPRDVSTESSLIVFILSHRPIELTPCQPARVLLFIHNTIADYNPAERLTELRYEQAQHD